MGCGESRLGAGVRMGSSAFGSSCQGGVSLPGAGVIVDEPGLRSLPIVGHERGLAKVFPEIAEAAQECRFRDCTHTHEPGCGVRAGQEAGHFSLRRLECYVALATEMRQSALSLDPDVVI